tara:strand:- start:3274 stop:3789 length:516 start_codon:yes stop_codon:yes gene_type:complete
MIDKKIPYWINTKFISDKRGSLYKFINHKVIKEIKFKLIEAQISEYKKNVFRGFYAQLGRSSEMKLIQLLEGKVFWFTINLKKNKYYGKVDIFSLKKNKLLFVPKGYAHGSYSLDNSKVLVLANNIYNKKDYLGINYKDKNVFKKIKRYLKKKVIISNWHKSFKSLELHEK